MNENEENPTTVLRQEHQVILRVLGAFNRFLDAGEASGKWDWKTLEECISFFRLYADACHHCKEEDLLFPELEAKGMPRDGGPIGVMLHEHRLGREHVQGMVESLPGARSGELASRERFFALGRAYITLLSEHIGKEDHCLFAMADRMIDQVACHGLCRKYREVSNEHFEGASKDALESMARRLELISS